MSSLSSTVPLPVGFNVAEPLEALKSSSLFDPPSKGGCRESRPQPGVRVVEGWSYNPHMGLARNLERRLEKLVDGLSATVFRGRMHPVDLANRLVRQAAVSDGSRTRLADRWAHQCRNHPGTCSRTRIDRMHSGVGAGTAAALG